MLRWSQQTKSAEMQISYIENKNIATRKQTGNKSHAQSRGSQDEMEK